MNCVLVSWTSSESRCELLNTILNQDVAGELATEDANSWGFFKLPSNRLLVVGYANIGLFPVAVLSEDRLLVGINEVLASFDAHTLEKQFSYRMPTVFHEFLSVVDPILVRDEVGFVSISADGKERWRFFTGGPINNFVIDNKSIIGDTIDNESFAFDIPL